MSNLDEVLIGSTPEGTLVYASMNLLSQKGIDVALRELVEVHWHRAGMLPPGYKRERTSPLDDETRIIADESRKHILDRIAQRMRDAADR